MIQFINQFPADKKFTYDERIALLRKRKVEQTAEKAKKTDRNGCSLSVRDDQIRKIIPLSATPEACFPENIHFPPMHNHTGPFHRLSGRN